jgi:uncharacterized protein with gpF-like domain
MPDKPKPKKATPIRNNAALEEDYSERLQALVDKMTGSVSRQFNGYFTPRRLNDKKETITTKTKLLIAALLLRFRKKFREASGPYARHMINSVNVYSSTATQNSLFALPGKRLNTKGISKEGKAAMQALFNENKTLINSLCDHYFTNLSVTIMQAIVEQLPEQIEQIVEKQNKVVTRRAKTIAVDQLHKAMQAITKQKLLDQGFTRFAWVYTYRSKEPRKSHVAMNGKIYRFDAPPITNLDNKGQEPRRGYPGTEINCKCVMRPVADWEKESSNKRKR